jgi:hypothetical protein
LPVARLDVLEAVPLLGQRAHRLREQADLARVERELARARAKRLAADGDHVADVEPLIDGEALVAEPVAARIDLEALAAVLEVEEGRFAEITDRHRPAGDSHLGCVGEPGLVEAAEACLDLARGMVRTEVVREWIRTARAQFRELPPPDHDLLVVLRHASFTGVVGLYWDGRGGSRKSGHEPEIHTGAPAVIHQMRSRWIRSGSRSNAGPRSTARSRLSSFDAIVTWPSSLKRASALLNVTTVPPSGFRHLVEQQARRELPLHPLDERRARDRPLLRRGERARRDQIGLAEALEQSAASPG